MLTKATNLITGTVRGLLGGQNERSEAARKAARTRDDRARKRSETAKKAAATRSDRAAARSGAAKKAAETRRQRDARVEAMVESTKRS